MHIKAVRSSISNFNLKLIGMIVWLYCIGYPQPLHASDTNIAEVYFVPQSQEVLEGSDIDLVAFVRLKEGARAMCDLYSNNPHRPSASSMVTNGLNRLDFHLKAGAPHLQTLTLLLLAENRVPRATYTATVNIIPSAIKDMVYKNGLLLTGAAIGVIVFVVQNVLLFFYERHKKRRQLLHLVAAILNKVRTQIAMKEEKVPELNLLNYPTFVDCAALIDVSLLHDLLENVNMLIAQHNAGYETEQILIKFDQLDKRFS